MNICVRHLAALALGLALATAAQAQNLPGSNNSDNGPIHRANPNSMQGTQPNPSLIRGIQTAPTPRTPTLENGGIGNRYPQRDAAPSRPATETKAPTVDANGNRRP
ncbi:hypothetical protein A7317_12295 [Pseudomonas fluorescens]|jgi:hypothetical protein|uniref:Lipoprotein n=4 Tax=Pseudomonas TaxID=286 RepID=A0A5M9J3L7_9PSED|nr:MULTISPECIES: hypothetical protein [Pseudomonas]AHC35595.1 hypothetical protein U771_15350 [Pseudomonas sp. TKP]AOE67748.1 hypothetical protein A7317_12295 [Pseudomonas fluorescens]AOE73563.1 hypothetical protein A7319_12280 [Pseudomonas fluorescens]KAA6171928.1 hypothetical protein F3K54_21705 [Pseudomonas veronii]KAA6176856.1 hypothetical protein F3K53_17785 [Pseudomonas veronii]